MVYCHTNSWKKPCILGGRPPILLLTPVQEEIFNCMPHFVLFLLQFLLFLFLTNNNFQLTCALGTLVLHNILILRTHIFKLLSFLSRLLVHPMDYEMARLVLDVPPVNNCTDSVVVTLKFGVWWYKTIFCCESKQLAWLPKLFQSELFWSFGKTHFPCYCIWRWDLVSFSISNWAWINFIMLVLCSQF